MAMKAPNITTTTMIVPSMIVGDVRVDGEQRQVGAHQPQDEDRDDRADEPAAPAAEHDAAEHHGGDAGEQVGAGDRRADAGRHGERQPAHRREEAGEGVGGDPGARDRHAAAEGGELARADGVDREPEPRAARAGSRRRRGRRRAATSAFGIQAVIASGTPGIATVPTISARSQAAAAPPGASSTRSAAPWQTKSIASVTTMSGTRGHDDQDAVERPEREAHQQHERDDEDRGLLAGAVHQRGRR